MNCGYYDSFTFGWFIAGVATGFLTQNIISDILSCQRKHRRVIHYIPIHTSTYTPTRAADDDIVEEGDPDMQEDSEYGYENESDEEREDSSVSEDDSADVSGEDTDDSFQKGDNVVVDLPPDQDEPSFGWGGVQKDDIGIIVSSASEYFRGKICYRVDFPNHKYWLALASELRNLSA